MKTIEEINQANVKKLASEKKNSAFLSWRYSKSWS